VGDTSLSRVSSTCGDRVDKSYDKQFPSRGERRTNMIQLLAARIQLAKMRAEEGQALVEYALIVSLIAVVAIAALTVTGHSIRDILTNISNDV
jgi:pilus assembly protein Flp/PilA